MRSLRACLNGAYLLANAAYLGVTRHKEKQYEGTHPPIIDRDIWDQVQARLVAASAERQAGPLLGERARLEGRLFDDRDNPMVAVHTRKRAKRYRYYISRPKLSGKGLAGSLHRVSAGLIEQFLIDQLQPRLSASWSPAVEPNERVLGAAKRVVIGADRLDVIVPSEALAPEAGDRAERLDDGGLLLRFAFELRRRQGAMILEAPGSAPSASPNPDRALIRAVVMAKTWTHDLEAGAVASIKALAKREGLCNHYASRLLPLAYLAPDLVELIIAGRQPPALSLATLTAQPLPLGWTDQRDLWRRLGSAVASTLYCGV